MTWLCGRCGPGPANTLPLVWVHPVVPPHGRARWVRYQCHLLCADCAASEDDPTYHRRPDEELLTMGLTAATKGALVNQVLSQVVGKARGYVPKTDLRQAITRLRKA